MTRANPVREVFRHFQRRERFNEGWSEIDNADRAWEELYRGRWQYDKVVRSTHGVNCTGSCSWMVYVKDGLVVWEHQAVDYPTNGPDMPEYEPRGCPRGASFSWYIYSPLRVKYPYVRGELLRLWRDALAKTKDPVEAWRSIVEDPELSRRYKSARGKGGFVRVAWDEALQLISAALVYTIKRYGPDRIFGFTPIPAMSMVSYSAGARFIELIGGVMMSFYDWYADLPAASPQVWGEQTDVPESADWYNSTYLIVWGTNIAMTRTPDAHFLAEARYRGAKVVVITTDYTDVTKFADAWLAPRPGTDGALAMAMLHVVLKEFYVDGQVPYFVDYVKKYTDLPFLVVLEREGDAYRPGRFLRASDLGLDVKNAQWKTVLLDSKTGRLVVPNGSIGFRWSGEGRWNLKLEDSLTGQPVDPALTLLGIHDEVAQVRTYAFDERGPVPLLRGVPVKRIQAGGKELLVATVFDLLMAHVGVPRGLPGDYPNSYDDPKPFTPAWQEAITGVDRKAAIRIAREFARNAELTRGRSMVLIGPGVNHWFHADLAYRAIISILALLGTIGVNGGGWAHYVGQEKVRPLDSWSTIAFAQDWQRPPRLQNTPSWMYIHSDQYRYEDLSAREIGVSPRYEHPVDYNVDAVKRGWLPFYPQLPENPISLYQKLVEAGAKTDEEVAKKVKEMLARGELKLSVEDPDAPENFPRVLFIWRSNLLASSGKGHEYILRHLLGADNSVMAKEGAMRPKLLTWREPAPTGKLDLVVTLDFRMSTSALYSDVVLPAATWYEKHDLSTTDLHPFIHPFNPA
ncbi:MAG: nitrate reductase subunit alpha, partial [Thermoproteus sp.]